MRKNFEQQYVIGQIPIDKIEIDTRCRDEIPKILFALKHIYCNTEVKEKIFEVLEKIIPENVDKSNGRPGMYLWNILVLGVLRVSNNWDYDKLQDIVNNHDTIRKFLGHSDWIDKYKYPL